MSFGQHKETLSDRMVMTGGRSSGFDYLRIVLASSIILWHGIPIAYGAEVELGYWRGPLGVLMHFVLPMFFALSGFLVAGSLERTPTLFQFFGLRTLRILPALAVEIFLSALLLGPLVTQFSVERYFSDPIFAQYFFNLAGYIHYHLPGVFVNNPLPQLVNAQLWTIPFELQCYVVLGVLATIGLAKRPWLVLLFVVIGQAAWIEHAFRLGEDGSSNGASGPTLLLAFLVGLLFYHYRQRILFSKTIFGLTVLGSLLLSALPHGAYYLPIPATYITVYLGLLNPRKIWAVASGDYSYGLFLYGYPIQQFVSSWGGWAHHWWINVAVSLPLAAIVSYLSWHGIEKRALALRRRLPVIEKTIGRFQRPNALTVEHGALSGGLQTLGTQPVGVPTRTAVPPRAVAMQAVRYVLAVVGILLLLNAREVEGLTVLLAGFGISAAIGAIASRRR